MSSKSSSVLASLTLTGLLFSGASAENSPDCPGVFVATNGPEGSESLCCVGGTQQSVPLSTCAGWPICSGSATTTFTQSPLSCATAIVWQSAGDNSAYSSLVSKASQSLAESGTHIRTTLGVTGGQVASSAGASATATATAGSSASTSASASATQSTSSNGSGVLTAQLGLVAGSVLALAVML